MSPSPIQISLFATLSNQMQAVFPVFRASKATLVDISHTLEDCILVNKLPSVIFTGFRRAVTGAQKHSVIWTWQALPVRCAFLLAATRLCQKSGTSPSRWSATIHCVRSGSCWC